MSPVGMKTRSVARGSPVSVCQPHGVAERVDLPFALAQLGAYRGLVVLAPRAGLSAEVERVGVRVDQDTSRLPVDDPGDHIFELPIFPRERQVGRNLRGRVAQPHGVDVSRDHVGVRSVLVRAESDSSVKRVREAVLKQPGKLRVDNRTFYFDDLRFDRFAHEPSLSRRGAVSYKFAASCKERAGENSVAA